MQRKEAACIREAAEGGVLPVADRIPPGASYRTSERAGRHGERITARGRESMTGRVSWVGGGGLATEQSPIQGARTCGSM